MKEHKALLFSLYRHGIEVFDTAENFKKWLNTENMIFDNKMPKKLLCTIEGTKFVNDRIIAIAHGDTV